MAVTQARDNEKFAKKPKVGSSGGVAPEGHTFMTVGASSILGLGMQEDVIKRGKEADEARFKEANKFMQSLKKADDVDPDEVAQKHEKEALAKPTAPGADVARLEAGKGQPAKVTIKEEQAQVLAEESAKKQAEGNVEEGDKARKAAEAAKKEAKK